MTRPSAPDEGLIARRKRRNRELGVELMAMARLEAEKLTEDLGREPFARERIAIEQAAALTVRVRKLREWGEHREANQAMRLLLIALDKTRHEEANQG